MKKIAIAQDNGHVSLHFGQCEGFMVFTTEEGEVTNSEFLPNPGHEPGVLPPFLAEHGVNIIIAGGMGPRAMDIFKEHGIDVVVGALGESRQILNSYLDGTLKTEDSSCSHT